MDDDRRFPGCCTGSNPALVVFGGLILDAPVFAHSSPEIYNLVHLFLLHTIPAALIVHEDVFIPLTSMHMVSLSGCDTNRSARPATRTMIDIIFLCCHEPAIKIKQRSTHLFCLPLFALGMFRKKARAHLAKHEVRRLQRVGSVQESFAVPPGNSCSFPPWRCRHFRPSGLDKTGVREYSTKCAHR